MRVGKQVCESMSLMSVRRLFQTSGPLTENARRPNCEMCTTSWLLWHSDLTKSILAGAVARNTLRKLTTLS